MTNEERIPNLQTRRKETWKDLKAVHNLLIDAEENCKNLRSAYQDLKSAYEEVDKALALIDGRCVKCEEQKGGSKKKQSTALDKEEVDELISKMSEAEINATLIALGIQLPEVEEVPMPKDVTLDEEEDD
jgi:hypothetical protein